MSAFDPKRTSGQSLNDLCLNSHLTPQYAVRRCMPDISGSRSLLTAELGPKRLELLHQLLPDAAVVAMLIHVGRDR